VRFIYSSKIIVHDITLKDCTAWCLHLAWVTTSHVYNVNIITPDLPIAHNTDGVDIDCSVDILVENIFYKGSRCCSFL
jgi:polygalacturonase